jgi:carbonic anhydrase/acetyltransferase-like protein (isoleucine patch superfamily)
VAIYALGDQVPDIDPTAFVHPEATIIGSVTVDAGSSIWPGAVLRGDDGFIRIGRNTSIQDGSVLHTTPMFPTIVGDECIIGHIVHLEGCTVEDRAQVSNGAIVLHQVIVRTGSIVAANAVVLNGLEVPAGALAVGAPAVIKEGRAKMDVVAMGVQSYVHKTARYRAELRRID